MSDRPAPRSDSVYVRGPVPEKQPAQRVLGAAGWRLSEFIIACLRALTAEPSAFLHTLEQHRPQRKRGRPPLSR